MVHQVAIPLEHTITGIFLGCIDNLICLSFNLFVDFLVPSTPLLGLGEAGKDEDQLELWYFAPQLEDYASR